jgi:ketosteroid isomerase-like protein
MEHSDAVTYRRTADAFRARDSEALAQLIADDVIWHVPGGTPLAGDIEGLEALFRWFERLHLVTKGTFMLREHDVLANDHHVVALSDMSSESNGLRVSVNVVSVMHFRDGRQLERWFHPSDPAAWDALLGGA